MKPSKLSKLKKVMPDVHDTCLAKKFTMFILITCLAKRSYEGNFFLFDYFVVNFPQGGSAPLLPMAEGPWPMLSMLVLDPNHPD